MNNLWQDTLKDPFKGIAEFLPDVSKSHFDIVIVGAGFTGLSAALHAAQAGKSVCVLEAHTVGHGGSGRNVGYVNAGLWTPPDEVEELLGTRTGARLNNSLADGPQTVFDLIETHQIRCQAVRQATLHCAENAKGLKDLQNRYRQQAARGAPVRLLDKDEATQRIGSSQFLGALWDPRAGTIQPLAYAQGLAKAASQAGAMILEETPAQSFLRQDGVWIIDTKVGAISGEKLIQATNAYGVAGAHQNAFIPVHYFQYATAPLSNAQRETILPGGEGCWDCASVMSSFRLDEEGRLLIGAVGNLEGHGRAIHAAWARRQLSRLFPDISDVPFTHKWCGRIAFTSDHLPKVVAIGENAVSIFGYSGRGISPGTVFGQCAANWAVNDDEDAFPIPIIDSHSESLTAPKAAFYEMGAVLTHLVRNRF